MMLPSSDRNIQKPTRNPLIPIGLTILAILAIPPFIYSVAPKGPIKKDNVVFSTGQHRTYFVHKTQYQSLGYDGFCVLQDGDQLLVLESAEAREDGTYLAQKIGRRKRAFPDCPSQSKVFLHEHQITLKPDMWGGLQDTLTWFFSSE